MVRNTVGQIQLAIFDKYSSDPDFLLWTERTDCRRHTSYLSPAVLVFEIPKTSVKEPAARNTGVLETAGIGREGCDRVGLP